MARPDVVIPDASTRRDPESIFNLDPGVRQDDGWPSYRRVLTRLNGF